MKAKTHPTDEKKVKTSSDSRTIDIEKTAPKSEAQQQSADKALQPEGLTVKDISEQSAYEDDKQEIAQIAAGSQSRKRKERN